MNPTPPLPPPSPFLPFHTARANLQQKVAAANAAYMLRRGRGRMQLGGADEPQLPWQRDGPQPPRTRAAEAALWYHQRAADQGNLEALVEVC